MRILLILAPLTLLAACNRTPPSILNNVQAEPPAPDNMLDGMNFSLGDPGYIPAAEMQPRSIAALRTLLPGAETARYDGLRLGRLGSICGTVRPAEGSAPGRTFVVAPDGRGAIARTPRVDLTRLDDPFVDQYIRYCASEEDVGAAGNQTLPAPPPAPAPPVPVAPRPPMQPERWNGPAADRVTPSPERQPNSFREAVRPPR